MNPTIEELHNSGRYELVETVDYSKIAGFVISHLKPKERVLWFFYVFFGITILVFAYYSGMQIKDKLSGIFGLLGKSFLMTWFLLIPIVPIHELLHGVAFKFMGAQRLLFGANVKEMIFYVTVDRFVLNRNQFYFLALIPFIVIAVGCIFVLCFPVMINYHWIASLLLSFHTSCCIGDFVLMSYFSKFGRNSEVYNYDDVTTKTSYFFRKIQAE